MPTTTPDPTASAALTEKKKLHKSFRLFAMSFYTVATLLSIDTLGAVSSQGGQVLFWLLISALTFLLPYGLLVAELGTTFPLEGGVYEWCRLAGGRFYAALGAMFYWISNPLWLGGTLSVTAIAAIKSLWFGNARILFGGKKLTDALIEMGIALLLIWGTIWCVLLSLRVGTWLSIIGSQIKLALFSVFVLLALSYAMSGRAAGQHLLMTDLLPTGDWSIIVSVILPVLIFNWMGFEVQNGASEEMINPRRDIPLSILRAGCISVMSYMIPVAVILLMLPRSQLSNASGFVQSFKVVVSVLPGAEGQWLSGMIAIGVMVALASSGGSWIIGGDRTYAIAALDRAAPASLGYFSTRHGTPIVMHIFSGVIATIAVAVAILVNTYSSGSMTTLFSLVLGFSIFTTTISYLFVFPAYLLLRYKYPSVVRPYCVPGGLPGAWTVTVLTTGYAAIASYFTLIPPTPSIKSLGISRFAYETTELSALGFILLLTIVFYLWGHKELRT